MCSANTFVECAEGVRAAQYRAVLLPLSYPAMRQEAEQQGEKRDGEEDIPLVCRRSEVSRCAFNAMAACNVAVVGLHRPLL
jgi:hypothetical protein